MLCISHQTQIFCIEMEIHKQHGLKLRNGALNENVTSFSNANFQFLS